MLQLAYMSPTTPMATLAVLVSLVVCVTTLASDAAGMRVELTRIHSGPTMDASQFACDALRRDMNRHNARWLAAASSGTTVSAPTQSWSELGEYMMTLAIGTPALSYQAIADTGSDLIWTQCAPCGDQCFQQLTPLYNPANSTTYSELPCDTLSICAAASDPAGCACPGYNYTYVTGWTSGVQGSETFTFGSATAANQTTSVPGMAFGCSNASSDLFSPSAGIVGLGRGNLSLVTQLGSGKFSYCFPAFDTSSTSTLVLGPSASLNDTGVLSTPFVANPAQSPSHYYLNLTGISLGTTALSISSDAFSLNSDGSGGIVIDSGTTVTSLVDAAYQQVRAGVLSQVTTLSTIDESTSTGLDLCFALPNITSEPPAMAMPNMTLHFDGADMVLPVDSYMIEYVVSGSAVWCLAMRNQTSGGASILGNYQQQNMHILYDLGQETLSFAPANCSAL